MSELPNKYADARYHSSPSYSFDKSSKRLNSQGVQQSFCKSNFALGTDSTFDHPAPNAHVSSVLATGHGAEIAKHDTPQVNFKSCASWGTLAAKNRYFGKQFDGIQNEMGLHSPGPARYNTRTNPEKNNSIPFTMGFRGLTSFEAHRKNSRKYPGPADYEINHTINGTPFEMRNGKRLTIPLAERTCLVNPALYSLPNISKIHDDEYLGKYSPGPMYDTPVGTIASTHAKGMYWGRAEQSTNPRRVQGELIMLEAKADRIKERMHKSEGYRPPKPFVPVPVFQSPPRRTRGSRTCKAQRIRQSAPAALIFTISSKSDHQGLE